MKIPSMQIKRMERTEKREDDVRNSVLQKGVHSRQRVRCHIHKGYDCCRKQTDMARRYPDDDPLRHMSSHSVALIVGLCMERHHQHEIPGKAE